LFGSIRSSSAGFVGITDDGTTAGGVGTTLAAAEGSYKHRISQTAQLIFQKLTEALKAGRAELGSLDGRLEAGGIGGGRSASAGWMRTVGKASAPVGPLDVVFGIARFPYKDAAVATEGLVREENAGRLEAGGTTAFGVLGF